MITPSWAIWEDQQHPLEEKTKMFIGTEAPQELSFGVYWRMVWLTKASFLVVITQKVDEKNVKSHFTTWKSSITTSQPLGLHAINDLHIHFFLSVEFLKEKKYIMKKMRDLHKNRASSTYFGRLRNTGISPVS